MEQRTLAKVDLLIELSHAKSSLKLTNAQSNVHGHYLRANYFFICQKKVNLLSSFRGFNVEFLNILIFGQSGSTYFCV